MRGGCWRWRIVIDRGHYIDRTSGRPSQLRVAFRERGCGSVLRRRPAVFGWVGVLPLVEDSLDAAWISGRYRAREAACTV